MSLFSRCRHSQNQFDITDLGDALLPTGWAQCIHPEGGTYFANRHLGLFTNVDINRSPNLALLLEAEQELRNQLIDASYPSPVDLVITFSDEMRDNRTVDYYMVDHALRQIGWLGFTAQTFNMSIDCFQSYLRPQYWKHIENYPGGIPMNTAAENGLEGRLMAGQMCINRGLTPWTSYECQQILSILRSNRDNNPEDHRMAEIGKRLSVIYTHLHFKLYAPQGLHQAMGPVLYVQHRPVESHGLAALAGVEQPALLPRLRLKTVDLLILLAIAHLAMLFRLRRCLIFRGAAGLFGLFTGSAATLLLPVVAPGIYTRLAVIIGRDATQNPFRCYLLVSLVLMNTLEYSAFLGGLGRVMAQTDLLGTSTDIDRALLLLALFSLPLALFSQFGHAFPRETEHGRLQAQN